MQPLLVRPVDDGGAQEGADFELVAGERRWRAAQRVGLHEVPVLVRGFGDSEVIEIALVENLQREDLSALEEAEAYSRLMREFGRSQASLAEAVGKSRSHVANTVRLLSLPPPVRKSLEEGALSAGHARALLAAPDPVALAEEVVRRGLNVRATENLVRRRARTARAAAATAARRRHARARTRSVDRARPARHAGPEIARRQPDAALYEPRPARPGSGAAAAAVRIKSGALEAQPAPDASRHGGRFISAAWRWRSDFCGSRLPLHTGAQRRRSSLAKKAELELEPQSAELVSRAVVNRDREPGLLLDQFPRPIERLVFGAEALRADPIVQMRIAARHSRRIPVANTISHRLTPFLPWWQAAQPASRQLAARLAV